MEAIKVKQLYPGIFHLKFKTQYYEADTFMRLQEFYESPFTMIRGKYFSREKYMDRYVKEYGKFDYLTKWSGFNVPGNIVDKFFTLFYADNIGLTMKEDKLLDIVSNLKHITGKYYIIATHKDDDLAHEIAHGFYYMYKGYRIAIEGLLYKHRNTGLFLKLRSKLLEMGYCKSVIRDEIQAYLASDTVMYVLPPRYMNSSDKAIAKEFRDIFNKYKK